MLTIFYSPHAMSVDNEAGRASGHADIPLSEAGRSGAQELGRHYAGEALDAVFCSDLQRARLTGEIAFTGRGLPLLLDARLREFDYGDMTQHPRAEVEAEFARRISAPFPQGESVRMAIERVGAFLSEVVAMYDGKRIVVIGHRATKWGLDYWSGDTSLEEVVHATWEWREVPIWRYAVDGDTLARRASAHA